MIGSLIYVLGGQKSADPTTASGAFWHCNGNYARHWTSHWRDDGGHVGAGTCQLEIESSDAQIKEIASKLRQAGILHVGVVGKFSARNPSQEKSIN